MHRIVRTPALVLLLAWMGLAQGPPPTPSPTLTLTLTDALNRAQANSQQLLSADLAARIAHEDKVQAKAALLPTANWFNGFIYTQPNGTSGGVFVPNDGPHVYTNWATVHADYSESKRADYQSAIAGEAVARARLEIAQRGIAATVVQNYYGMVSAQRHYANLERALNEARQFLDITQKQEAGGEAARSDVVKAQIEVNNRERDIQEARLAMDKARIGFAVFLFPDFRQDFNVMDDLDQLVVLPPWSEIEGRAQENNPDVRAAQATVMQQNFSVKSARAARYPTFTMDYYYGIQANQYALHNHEGQNLVGSSVSIGTTIPIWNWGAVSSKIRQSELRLQQARTDLSLTQRQLMANLNAYYLEAATASSQMTSLRAALDLSEQSLDLTRLRYQAGEASVLDVVDAQRTAVDARNAYVDGKTRYRVALAAIQTLTGTF
jgi:outer membrane protein TolC